MTREAKSSENALDKPIREIIYFDLNRVTSYLSQIQDGLTEYFEQTGTSSKQEAQHGTQFQLGRGAAPIGVTFGRKDSAIFDTTMLVERKKEHHAALTILEEVLRQKEVLGAIDDGKPFVKHIGHPLVIDYPYLAKRFRGFKKLQTALQGIADIGKEPLQETAQEGKKRSEREKKEKAEAFKKFEDFAEILEASEERLELYFDEPKIVAPLVRDFLQLPSEMIEHTYGSPSRNKMTLIGLDVTGEPRSLDLKVGDNMAASTAWMTSLFYSMVGKNFRYSDDYRRVIPIALYIETDMGSTN